MDAGRPVRRAIESETVPQHAVGREVIVREAAYRFDGRAIDRYGRHARWSP